MPCTRVSTLVTVPQQGSKSKVFVVMSGFKPNPVLRQQNPELYYHDGRFNRQAWRATPLYQWQADSREAMDELQAVHVWDRAEQNPTLLANMDRLVRAEFMNKYRAQRAIDAEDDRYARAEHAQAVAAQTRLLELEGLRHDIARNVPSASNPPRGGSPPRRRDRSPKRN